jgi:photosystem II stability/assembly factor-like uncharacterized protein
MGFAANLNGMRSSIVSALAAIVGLTTVAARADSGPPPAQLQWRSIGPAVSGGRVAAVVGTDGDPALYYAGAADGGVWKSTNGGQSWHPIFDGQAVAAIGAIAIDPKDKNTVWAGTGEANPRNDVIQGDGVYKTTDGGKTWTKPLPLSNSLISTILIDPRDPQRVLVGVLGDPFSDNVDRGVYRTTDGGKTWTKTLYLASDSGVSDMAMDSASPDVIYAGMWQYRRTGWSSQSGGPNDGLYRSLDGGATWKKLTGTAPGLPDGITGRIAVAIAHSNPKRIYAIVESGKGLLWRSDDAGATWTMVSNDTVIDERPFYFSHVFVDPLDADHLWSVSVHLTVSTDGGKTFSITGRGLHGDHHAMWIAPSGRRIIEGDDGGVGLSNDNGDSWMWDKNIPISQLYHIGDSPDPQYLVCAPLQDNSTWCAPSNPLDPIGLSASQWLSTGAGGDGGWVVPDPSNPARIWQGFAGSNNAGDVYIHDFNTGETRSIAPYLRDQNVVDPAILRYRFNWETPIAFDPFDAKRVLVAGDTLFVTTDQAYHWRPISGDLTRNIKAHQVITGGITLDGTGAETSDTIIDIAPSRASRGQIWIGTDDGYVQLTRDGGAHWQNVTPPGIAPYGRFGSISPSERDPSVAYAAYDRHMVGDRTPYLFATHDYGAHWSSIAAGLPGDDEVRSVLVDPRNAKLLYAGLDRSLWASWDEGAHWESIASNLGAVSMRDLRVQESNDDLLLATHGRGAYVLDDARPLQELGLARAAGTYLFPVRIAVEWGLNTYWGTRYDADGPPYGATATYYLGTPGAHAPTADILNARGTVIRTYATHDEDGKPVDDLTNDRGLNRFTWDFNGKPAVSWRFAPAWNQGNQGITVPPGTYTLRLNTGGRTLEQKVVVHPDPRLHYSQADYEATYALQMQLLAEFSRVDDALNVLGTVAAEAPLREAALKKSGNVDLAASVAASGIAATALSATFTSNPRNDQDDDFLKDVLRERIQTVLFSFTSYAPPTAEQLRESRDVFALGEQSFAAYAAFARTVDALDVKLTVAHLAPLRQSTVTPKPAGQGDNGRRG